MTEKDRIQPSCGCGSGGCGSHTDSGTHHPDGAERTGAFQLLREGDRVIDLGSGNGTNSINMAKITGASGQVTGIDLSPENIRIARELAEQQSIGNVEFLLGRIDTVPVPNESADLVFANCVFNLQENRQKVADEMYRICDHNGYVCVSDYVLLRDIPDGLRREAGELLGCIAGAENVQTFMDYFRKTGFSKGGIVEVNKVRLPADILDRHLSPEMTDSYNDPESDDGIFHVVLVVEKPETCAPGSCCCNPEKHANPAG